MIVSKFGTLKKSANLSGEWVRRLIILNVNWVKQVVGNIL